MTTKTTEELRRETNEAREQGEASRRELATLKLSKVLEGAGALEGVSRDAARFLLGEASDVRFDDHGELDLATWNGTRYLDPAALAAAYLDAHRYFTAEPRSGAADAPVSTTKEDTVTTKNTKHDAAKNFDEMSPEDLATVGLQRYQEAKNAKRKAKRAPKNLSPEELAERGLKGAV